MVGGWEVGHAIFVSEVTPDSKPAQVGLSVGDQVSHRLTIFSDYDVIAKFAKN